MICLYYNKSAEAPNSEPTAHYLQVGVFTIGHASAWKSLNLSALREKELGFSVGLVTADPSRPASMAHTVTIWCRSEERII